MRLLDFVASRFETARDISLLGRCILINLFSHKEVSLRVKVLRVGKKQFFLKCVAYFYNTPLSSHLDEKTPNFAQESLHRSFISDGELKVMIFSCLRRKTGWMKRYVQLQLSLALEGWGWGGVGVGGWPSLCCS